MILQVDLTKLPQAQFGLHPNSPDKSLLIWELLSGGYLLPKCVTCILMTTLKWSIVKAILNLDLCQTYLGQNVAAERGNVKVRLI